MLGPSIFLLTTHLAADNFFKSLAFYLHAAHCGLDFKVLWLRVTLGPAARFQVNFDQFVDPAGELLDILGVVKQVEGRGVALGEMLDRAYVLVVFPELRMRLKCITIVLIGNLPVLLNQRSSFSLCQAPSTVDLWDDFLRELRKVSNVPFDPLTLRLLCVNVDEVLALQKHQDIHGSYVMVLAVVEI